MASPGRRAAGAGAGAVFGLVRSEGGQRALGPGCVGVCRPCGPVLRGAGGHRGTSRPSRGWRRHFVRSHMPGRRGRGAEAPNSRCTRRTRSWRRLGPARSAPDPGSACPVGSHPRGGGSSLHRNEGVTGRVQAGCRCWGGWSRVWGVEEPPQGVPGAGQPVSSSRGGGVGGCGEPGGEVGATGTGPAGDSGGGSCVCGSGAPSW